MVTCFPDVSVDGFERYGVFGSYEETTPSVLSLALRLDAVPPGECVPRDFGVSISGDHLRFLKEHEVNVILLDETFQFFFLCRYSVYIPLHDVEFYMFRIFEFEV